MKFLAGLRSLAAKFFHRSETAHEVEEELRSHIAAPRRRSGTLRPRSRRSGTPRAHRVRRA